MTKEVDKIMEQIEKDDIRFVRLQFVDINGKEQNVSIPPSADMDELFTNGTLFDGSSIAGFVDINDSDLIIKPDISTYSRLPWRADDSAVYNIGPEPEFFIVDIDNEGYPMPYDDAGYFDVEPKDKGPDFRGEITFNLQELGFEVEASHHEVGPGQNEIAFKFDDALKTADAVMTFKTAIKAIVANMAAFDELDYRVTFMPKPFFGVNGSGMHCHQSLFKDGYNLFLDPDSETGLSQDALYFIGGLLEHAPALTAITNPIVNSYKRLVPGYEAPVYRAYGLKNRSALVRVPAARGKATRIEYRAPDPACNPYLAFTAMLAAGMDGIKNKIDPGEPTEINIYNLTEKEREERGIRLLPASLWEAYHAFEENQVMMDALGEHISEKFLESKYQEWDDYRVQVFGYEQRRYLDI